MGSNDRVSVFTKILNGVVGVLLAVVGYFLVSRDAEFTAGLKDIRLEIASIRSATAQERTSIELLLQQSQWELTQNKEHELRIRELEKRR